MDKKMKVFFFGDSICFGQGVSVFLGWVPRLAQRAYEYGMERGCRIDVTNTSINGNTTRMALERMPYDIQGGDPDIVIVQFGMNDCNYWQTDRGNPRVSLAAFKANLQEIITRAKTFGAKKILINTNHPSARDQEVLPFTNITYQQSNEAYNAAIREVAGESDPTLVSFADIEEHFKQMFCATGARAADYLLEDQIHLNDIGHNCYFDFYAPLLMNAIAEVIK